MIEALLRYFWRSAAILARQVATAISQRLTPVLGWMPEVLIKSE